MGNCPQQLTPPPVLSSKEELKAEICNRLRSDGFSRDNYHEYIVKPITTQAEPGTSNTVILAMIPPNGYSAVQYADVFSKSIQRFKTDKRQRRPVLVSWRVLNGTALWTQFSLDRP